MRGVLLALLTWVVMAGLYLLFAGQNSATELIVGAPAATLATGFAIAVHRAQTRELRLGGPWPRLVVRPLLALLPDAVRVGGVLLGAIWRRPDREAGLVARQAFRHGGQSDAGRRALSTLATSLAPNGYVIALPDDEDVLLMHRLTPAAPDRNTEWPA